MSEDLVELEHQGPLGQGLILQNTVRSLWECLLLQLQELLLLGVEDKIMIQNKKFEDMYPEFRHSFKFKLTHDPTTLKRKCMPSVSYKPKFYIARFNV